MATEGEEAVPTAGGSSTPPGLGSADDVPHNLPVALTSFVGRYEELAEIARLLERGRLVTLSGVGGCGKTRLALQAAKEASGRYPEGLWFVDLGALSDPTLVASAVADAVGLGQEPGPSLPEALGAFLRRQRALVVLDNCEHLVEACAELAKRLLDTCPGLTVLATSRETLGVDGELSWRVPSMSAPADPAVPAEASVAYDAVNLFVQRAVAARSNFSLSEANAPAVARICQRLDGLPLAIELAAARVRVLSAEQIAAGLDDRFRLLGAGPRTAFPRHATLAASIDWSYDGLAEDERVLLTRLSVFAGGFDLDATETVCGSAPLSEGSVLDLLDALVMKSLVLADEGERAVRYRLLETIRQYANGRLIERGEAPATRSRHLTHFAEVATPPAAGWSIDWLVQLDRDTDNVRAALKWAIGAGEIDSGLRLAGALPIYWAYRGKVDEGQRWLEDLLVRADDASPGERGLALWGVGWLATFSGDMAAQVARAAEALPLARQADDRDLVALCLATLAYATSMDDPSGSRRLLEEALTLAEDSAQSFTRAHVQYLAGCVLGLFGELDDANRHLLASLELAQRTGAHSVAPPLLWLGTLLWIRGDLAAAAGHLGKALEEARTQHLAPYACSCLGMLALVQAMRGEHDSARGLVGEALTMAADLPGELAATHLSAATAAAFRGEPAEANEHARAALATQPLDSITSLGASAAAAHAVLALGDDAAVAEHLHALAGVDVSAARTFMTPFVLLVQGRVLRSQGELERSEDVLQAGLAIAADMGLRPWALEILGSLAGIALDLESDEEAARILGGVEAHRSRDGFVSHLDPARAADLARLQTALDDGSRQAAWAEGAALSFDDLVAYARRGRGERKRPASGWASLTPVETQVIELVREGLTNKEIGERLFVSVNTVRTHLAHVFNKLGVANRAELAARAAGRRPR